MSVFISVSSQELIARIIRKTRVKDTSYIEDMDEWIPEVMGLMKTKAVLSNKWEDVQIEFHKGKLPLDMRKIKAVEHHGHRLRKSNQVRTLGIPETGRHKHVPRGTTNGFEYIPQFYDTPSHTNPQENSIILTQDLVSTSADHCEGLPCAENLWYDTELEYILVPFHTGKIRIHYRAIPVDELGFPLIPDNEWYKEAAYLYCRAQMIGAGWEDRIFNYNMIMDEEKGYFPRYAARAIAEIRYPSVDEMEYKVHQMTRLIKDEHYFDNFFNTPHEEKRYGYEEYLYNVSPGDGKTYLNKDFNPNKTKPNSPDFQTDFNKDFNKDFNNDFS